MDQYTQQTNYQPMPGELPGSKMIKVIGILMIVFGAIGTVAGFIAFAGLQVLKALASQVPDLEGIMGSYNLALIISLISAIVLLVCGIMGAVNAKKPVKASGPMIFAVISLALVLIGNIMSMVLSNQLYASLNMPHASGSTVFSLLLGAVMPVLMIVGCIQKNKALNNTQAM